MMRVAFATIQFRRAHLSIVWWDRVFGNYDFVSSRGEGSRNMSRSLSRGLLVIVIGTLGIRLSAAEPEYRYHYFKEPRPLVLDTTRVAVLNLAGGAELTAAGQDALAQSRFDKDGVTDWPVAGWSLMRADVASDSTKRMSERVAAVASADVADFVSPVFVGSDGGPVIVTPDILIGFREGVDAAQAQAVIAASFTGEIAEQRFGNMPGAYRLRSRANNGFVVLDEANRLAQHDLVAFAEPDMIFTGSGSLVPNDPYFGDCWGLDNTAQMGGIAGMDMSAVEAWDITTGDPSIIVVVIDTGVEQTHPDIHQLTPGTDTTSDPSTDGGPVNVFDNHGTAVAGCVSATINNALGTVGIAPGCRSTSARTFISINSSGNWTSSASWTVDSLSWADSIGARVSNNSNQYGFTSSAIATMYAWTRDNGMVHFASAGNDGVPSITYPSSLSTVNSVAALRQNGQLTSFSNYGIGLAFSAPGIDVLTTDRTGNDGWVTGDYVYAWGTSFAAPYTAGVAALYLSRYPSATSVQVEKAMQVTCVDRGIAGWDTTYGWGFVNAYNVLQVDPACTAVAPPQVEPLATTKNRYLSLSPDAITGNAALRLTAVDLPAPYDVYNNVEMWVDTPVVYQESINRGTEFLGAPLSCTPIYRDWTTNEVIHVHGPLIVPGGVYSVDAILEGCDPGVAPHYSAPLELVATAPWGDVVAPFAAEGAESQPDFRDIASVVSKFLDELDAPLLMAADLEPADANRTVDFKDIAETVQAFIGEPYSFDGPVPCS